MNTKDDNPIKDDIKNRSSKLDYSELKKRYDLSLKTIEELEQQKSDILQIKNQISTFEIKGEKGLKSEATAFILLGDIHSEEIVKKSMVNGLNEYNIKIAEKRVSYFFINAIKLLKMSKKDTEIKELVFVILGDLISSNIHDELLENTSLRPIEAVIVVQSWIVAGIRYLLSNFEGNITIPMTTSNHTRITKKIHISNEIGNDLGYFVYSNISNIFANEKRIKCILPEGYHIPIKIYGKNIIIHHGHFIKYQGGVGGPTISINKAIAQWNKIFKADLYIQGHLHQYFDGGNFLINGSVIGFNPYAISIKASYEPPKQMFFLWDKRFGKTIVCPIILDRV